MTERVAKQLRKITERNNLPAFRQSGEFTVGKRDVGDAHFSYFNENGYTGITIDIFGSVVGVGENNNTDQVTIFSGKPEKSIPSKGRGWHKRLEKEVKAAFEKPGKFEDFELELGRRLKFG